MSSRTPMMAYAVAVGLIAAALGGVGTYWWLAGEAGVQARQTTALRTDLAAARADAAKLLTDVAAARDQSSHASAVTNGLRRVIAYQWDRVTTPHMLPSEPAGDIPGASLKRGVAFYARISKISTSTREVTFDVIVDSGRRNPNSDNTIWANRYRHAQTLKLESAYVPVLMWLGVRPDSLEGVDTSRGPIAGLDEYLAAIERDDADNPGELPDLVFIIHVDSRGVFALEQVYQA